MVPESEGDIQMVTQTILTDTPQNLAKKYKKVLEDHHIPVDKIIIFGSYVKNKQGYWSDLDLCIVSKEFGKNYYDETVILKQLTSNVDSMIEPHPYNPTDLQDPYDPLASEIRKNGKIVV